METEQQTQSNPEPELKQNQGSQFSSLQKIIVITILTSAVVGFISGGVAFSIMSGKSLLGPASVSDSAGNSNQSVITTPQEQAVEKAVKDTSPAVVSIIATKDLPVIQQYSDPFEQFFGGNPFDNLFPFNNPAPNNQQNQGQTQPQEVAGGSGFIISSDGLILTNKHVTDISGADYTVLMNDGSKYPAKILAQDPVQDIAILKIDKTGLPVMKLGDSDNLQIGQTVIAIGNALGEFRNTVSVGVISGLKRSVTASEGLGSQAEQLDNVIQTDAAINPGNSGGPLLNLSGEVVGINVAMAQGAQNIGFTLPINIAKRDIQQVQKQGKISYAFLGIRYIMINPDVKQKNNLSVDYGALIQAGSGANEPAITPASPAEKAGLEENDIILEADGQKIDADHPLDNIIQNHNVGDTISLRVLHQGQEKTIKVTLGER